MVFMGVAIDYKSFVGMVASPLAKRLKSKPIFIIITTKTMHTIQL